MLKALQKDPANRYQTAGEMARDIDAILYSFKPTPTSADLAIYMHRMSTTEPMMAPEPEPSHLPPPPVVTPAKPATIIPAVAAVASAPAMAVPAPVATPEPWEQHPPAAKKGSAMPLIAIGVVLLLAGIAGAVVVMNKKSDTPAATTPVATATSATTGAPATSTVIPLSTDTTLTTGTTGTALDPSAVDAEVQKRIAAERARLEALARQQAQQQGATATTAPARPAPVPVADNRPTPQQEAPAPVETRPTPAPVTQTQEPAPQVTAPAPAPQQAAPAAARAREGDLVPAGTEGLTPPRITRRGTVPYPPVARIQKIGGRVVMNVLVSETGQVMRVDVIRGVNRAVGLNEAAQETMRRSTFAPATKDGVRVKSWLTVPIDFQP